MRKLITNSLLLVFFVSSAAFGQLQEKWSASLTGDLKWQKVTLNGSHLVATNKGLAAYDQENGTMLWENAALAGYEEVEIEELGSSPLLLAKKGSNVSIFSPFDGRIQFNSKEAGVAELNNNTFLYKSNSIFVAGNTVDQKPVMLVVDNNTGQIRWKLEEKFGRVISVNEVSKDEMILTTLMMVYKFNTNTGDIIWKNATTAMGDSPLGQLFGAMAEEMTKNMDFVIRYYQDLDKGVLVIASESKNEKDVNGTISVTYENAYLGFRIKDGSRVWTGEIKMQGKLGDLAFHDNGIIVMPDNANNTRINYFEFEPSGTGKWGKKGNGTGIKGGVYTHVNARGNLLLVTQQGSNTFLNMLNPSSGELLYDKAVKISGRLVRTIITDAGITYITTEEMNILDPNSGNLLLGKSISTSPELIAQDGNMLYVFDQSSGTLKSVDTSSGQVKDISTVKLKFEGKESPTALEKRSNGYLVTSDQNLAMFGDNGDLKFQKYYKAPRESGLKRALLMAQAARAMYIGANAYAASAVLKAGTEEAKANDPVGGAVVEGFGMIYEELGNQASDFAKKSFQQAQARFKATAQGRDFMIILTEMEKGVGIVRVNKETGDIDATIDLGKDKEPKYALDDVTGRAFVAAGSSKISCYEF
jgi:hypothetical protein